MQPRIQPDASSRSFSHKSLKWIMGGSVVVLLIISLIYYFIPQYRFYYVPEELSPYEIPPLHNDDTLRIAFIGDSWADYHTLLSGDTIMEKAASKIYNHPVKTQTRGKKGALSKEVYFFMFSNKTTEHSYEPDRCTQPLIEEHPNYCVIFTGINDVTYLRTTSYYAENMRLIIQLLLHNNIRPVVMEIPLVNFTEPMHRKKIRERWFYKIRSILTGTLNNQGTDYQEALKRMLENAHLEDRVIYISAKQWNPKGSLDTTMFLVDRLHLNLNGYHRLDSCIATEIIKDYTRKNSNTQK